MRLDIVYHPRELEGRDLSRLNCVVLDVLRATTTMSNAIANGAESIHVFEEIEQAIDAHRHFAGPKLLAGERGCLAPAGFDLGNSPGAFTPGRVRGRRVFMSTTNGTRAIHRCRGAGETLVAALINAQATAVALVASGRDVLLVCAGVDGAPGGEDIDGAATIADAVSRIGSATFSDRLASDAAATSWHRHPFGVDRLRGLPGGINLQRAGLDVDIEFASRVDCVACACRVVYHGTDAIVVPLE